GVGALRLGMVFVIVDYLTMRLHARDLAVAVIATRRNPIFAFRVAVDPRQLQPATRVRFVGRDQLKALGVHAGRMPKFSRMARREKIERPSRPAAGGGTSCL